MGKKGAKKLVIFSVSGTQSDLIDLNRMKMVHSQQAQPRNQHWVLMCPVNPQLPLPAQEGPALVPVLLKMVPLRSRSVNTGRNVTEKIRDISNSFYIQVKV